MTDTTDILALMAEMERRAMTATPGPWNGGHRCDTAIRAGASGDRFSLAEVYSSADAAFIAAANPAAVLALLTHARSETARADALKSERDEARQNVERFRSSMYAVEDLLAVANARISVFERDRDADKARIATLVKALTPDKPAFIERMGWEDDPEKGHRLRAIVCFPEGLPLCSNLTVSTVWDKRPVCLVDAALAVADATAGTDAEGRG